MICTALEIVIFNVAHRKSRMSDVSPSTYIFYICLANYTEYASIIFSSDQPKQYGSWVKIYNMRIKKRDDTISRDLKGKIASSF